MRTSYLQALLVVMLASLLAWSPLLRSRIHGLATAATTSVLKSLVGFGFQERVAIAATTAAARSIYTDNSASASTSASLNLRQLSSQGQSPTQQERLLQSEDQFQQFTKYSTSIMASSETASTLDGSAPKCAATTSEIKVESKPASEPEPELPKLSSADFRAYNRLAVMMDVYHNHFRQMWNMLYTTCTTGSRPAHMSIRTFLTVGLQLCRQLTMHHRIEEVHVFPELAERMPAFAEHDHLITQHEAIHEGLVKLEEYLDACRGGERELRLPELKDVMDSFGTVLWAHLDDEVRMLGAENMRRYWTKEEIADFQW